MSHKKVIVVIGSTLATEAEVCVEVPESFDGKDVAALAEDLLSEVPNWVYSDSVEDSHKTTPWYKNADPNDVVEYRWDFEKGLDKLQEKPPFFVYLIRKDGFQSFVGIDPDHDRDDAIIFAEGFAACALAIDPSYVVELRQGDSVVFSSEA